MLTPKEAEKLLDIRRQLESEITEIDKILEAYSEVKTQKVKKTDKEIMFEEIEEGVSKFLISLGMPMSAAGFDYTKSAVALLLISGNKKISYTKQIYPEVAKAYEVSSWNCIERGIRYVKNILWNEYITSQKKENKLSKFFEGIRLQKPPTNAEFIKRIAREVRKTIK